MPRIFFSILFLSQIVSASLVLAQPVSVTAEVSQSKAALGEAIVLTVTANGGKDVSPVKLPTIDGLSFQFVGPSTRISIVNGQYSSSKAFIFNILPLKVGNFKIPALSVNIDGQDYKTEPVDIEITDSGGTGNAGGISGTDSSTAAPAQNLKDKIFLTLKTSKTEAYVHEPVLVKMFLYVSDISVRDVGYPEFDKSKFVADEFGQPKQYQQIFNGVRYEVVEFAVMVYPSEPGELVLGPAQLKANILYRNKSANPFGGFDSFFDDDFFGSFNYSKQPLTVFSDEVKINVSDVPQEGRPVQFNGEVGKFVFNADVSPRDISVGDPITVKMKISGDGNLKSVQMPAYKTLDGFKVYDPQIKEENGSKFLEQVLIPEKDNLTEVPSTGFSYFDTQAKAYKTITQGPFPITVKPVKKEDEAQVVTANNPAVLAAKRQENFGSDILYLKRDMGALRNRGEWLYRQGSFWILYVLIFIVFGTAYQFLTHKLRLDSDIQYARKRKAFANAAHSLNEIKKGGQPGFYDGLSKILKEYLSAKLNLPMGEVTQEKLLDLGAALVPDNLRTDLKDILETFEMVRFGSTTLDDSRKKNLLEQVEKFISRFEKAG